MLPQVYFIYRMQSGLNLYQNVKDTSVDNANIILTEVHVPVSV
jgi:hypothetical protein